MPALAPALVAPWLGPGLADEESEGFPGEEEEVAGGGEPTAGDGWYGLTAGIHQAVPGVATDLSEVHQPHTVQDTTMVAAAHDAWDKTHLGKPSSIELQQVCRCAVPPTDFSDCGPNESNSGKRDQILILQLTLQ